MKKELKKDLLHILILIIVFFIVYLALTRFSFLYGSTKDWNQQHWIIPEYFRKLFYENHDLFPDFAFNLGSGQNIYNFSYYGFLSPIILVSYLLPFIPMRTYIIISTIFMLLLSVVLIYFFIKKKYDSKIAFISSFIFLMATPLIFHSHRHIMFMNYMPFLILGYYGVDDYFSKNKSFLLTLSVFLMIMTSYFFSVSGIVSIILYGIYCYIKKNKRITVKSFLLDGIKFLIPILIGVLMSSILIVPTFYSLLNGRSSSVPINIFKLFLPKLDISNLLYNSYSIGLSSIALFSLIENIFNKRENCFLSLSLIIILIFPIILYLLNGFLYVDAKVLIVFLPAFILLISNTLSNVINQKIRYRYLAFLTIFVCSVIMFFDTFSLLHVLLCELPVMLLTIYLVNKKGNFKYFYYFLLPVLLIISICLNIGDNLVSKDIVDKNSALVNKILDSDSSFYRIGVYDQDLDSANKVYDLEYYESNVYSSSSSINLKDFYYNRLGNEIIFRSYGMMTNTSNLFYNIYTGNKYVVSRIFDSYLYDEIYSGIYKNDKVLPVGYATDKLMSLKYYNSLSYPDNIYAFLDYTIVDSDDVLTDFEPLFDRIMLDYEVLSSDVNYVKKDSNIYINSKDKSKIKLKINNNLDNKVLLISFKMNYHEKCSVGDTYIIINGIKNKLTCKGWKYQNENEVFEYVLSGNDLSELNIVLSKGKYSISDISSHVVDYSDIYDIVDNVDPFMIDRNKTSGDMIYGDIDVTRDGYFNLSIPYDRGFNIYVDGEKTNYEKVDVNFIGFKINKGHHSIKIEYKSPFKNVGTVLSIIGVILFIIEVFMITILSLFGNLVNEVLSPKTKLGKFIMGVYSKYKEIFNYLVVGVLTTIVSLGSKWILLFTVLDAEDAFQLQVAIIISWICAVLFAYFANRIFVFNSRNKNILKEMVQFFGARILTLVMEMVIMWFFVTLLKLNSDMWVVVWTFVTQVLIMIFNYIFSKLFVFRKK